MTRTQPPEGTGRATGVSLAAILLVLACFGSMVLLHVVRTDLDPVRQVMSEYANGRFGWFMTAAFYAMGLASIALAVRLGRAVMRSRLSAAVRLLLGLGGLGLILAGVFEVERPAIPDTVNEIIHSDATLTAFTLIITAMLLFAVVCRRDPRWGDFRVIASVLAIVAAAAGAFSPFAGQTTWSGLAQRVLGLAVVSWLLLCALHIRFGGLRRSRSAHPGIRGRRTARGDALSARLRPVAIALLLSSVAGLVLLHLLRSDRSPVRDRLSEYANGSYGAVMTISFFLLGAGLLVLGVAIWADGAATGWSRVVPLTVIVAGCGMVVSGLYPTDPAGAPTTTELVHSLASGSATMALIGAAVVSSLLRPALRPPRAIGPAGVLAGAALAFGSVSPVVHGTVWTGLSQRLLWLSLMAWLLVTAWQLAGRHGAAPAGPASPSTGRGAGERPRVDGPASTDYDVSCG